METPENHKAGFVSIIGKPNVGKSTLMNALVKEKLSITTHKAQTTRHRIMGIINDENYQIVYSDTPGIITNTKYKLHESMMRFVQQSLEDADAVLMLTEPLQKLENNDVTESLNKLTIPLFVVINKIDLYNQEQVKESINYWNKTLNPTDITPVSALNEFNIERVLRGLLDILPQHPPFFPKDELSDKPERFFASEIIREKIFLNYKQEIPYSAEVMIEEFKEDQKLIKIRVAILVERKSQRGIIIGDKGSAIKKVGIQAREALEAFFNKKVYLEQFVKVEPGWRNKKVTLRKFGYMQ